MVFSRERKSRLERRVRPEKEVFKKQKGHPQVKILTGTPTLCNSRLIDHFQDPNIAVQF